MASNKPKGGKVPFVSPLNEMLKAQSDIAETLPLLRILPEKVGTVEIGLQDLKDTVIQKYVTFIQVDETMRIYTNQLEVRCKKEYERKIQDIKDDIDKRLPSNDMIEQLMKGQESYDMVNTMNKDVAQYKQKLEALTDQLIRTNQKVSKHNHLLKNSNKGEIDMLGVIVKKRANELSRLEEAMQIAMITNKLATSHDIMLNDHTSESFLLSDKNTSKLVCKCDGDCICQGKKLTTTTRLNQQKVKFESKIEVVDNEIKGLGVSIEEVDAEMRKVEQTFEDKVMLCHARIELTQEQARQNRKAIELQTDQEFETHRIEQNARFQKINERLDSLEIKSKIFDRLGEIEKMVHKMLVLTKVSSQENKELKASNVTKQIQADKRLQTIEIFMRDHPINTFRSKIQSLENKAMEQIEKMSQVVSKMDKELKNEFNISRLENIMLNSEMEKIQDVNKFLLKDSRQLSKDFQKKDFATKTDIKRFVEKQININNMNSKLVNQREDGCRSSTTSINNELDGSNPIRRAIYSSTNHNGRRPINLKNTSASPITQKKKQFQCNRLSHSLGPFETDSQNSTQQESQNVVSFQQNNQKMKNYKTIQSSNTKTPSISSQIQIANACFSQRRNPQIPVKQSINRKLAKTPLGTNPPPVWPSSSASSSIKNFNSISLKKTDESPYRPKTAISEIKRKRILKIQSQLKQSPTRINTQAD